MFLLLVYIIKILRWNLQNYFYVAKKLLEPLPYVSELIFKIAHLSFCGENLAHFEIIVDWFNWKACSESDNVQIYQVDYNWDIVTNKSGAYWNTSILVI